MSPDCRSDEEVWRDIPGFEGIYEASSLGRIRTAYGKTTWSSRYGCNRVWKQRVLKPKFAKQKGRLRLDARVTLYKDGVASTHLVSRLVASTFIGNTERLTVNHKDGNPQNNCIDNLELVSMEENFEHARVHGLLSASRKGIKIKNTETEQVFEFSSLTDASRFLGFNSKYMSEVLKRGTKLQPPFVIIEVK